jgi:hypothetical protein
MNRALIARYRTGETEDRSPPGLLKAYKPSNLTGVDGHGQAQAEEQDDWVVAKSIEPCGDFIWGLIFLSSIKFL